MRFRHYLPYPRRIVLAGVVSACQYAAVSGFVPWNGGWCYGPRYTTELVPWMVLVASLGLTAALRWHEDYATTRRPAEWAATPMAGGGVLGRRVFINPPGHVWDWHRPQFLAGLVTVPPDVFPVADTGRRIAFAKEAGRAFQLDGWSFSEDEWCWSEQHRATLIFAVNNPPPKQLRLCFGPCVDDSHPRQRIKIRLNGQTLADLELSRPDPVEYTFPIPVGSLGAKNRLTFEMPDAFSPQEAYKRRDFRLLGVALRWMELAGGEPTAPGPTPDASGQPH